ncbi:MAG: hypothetical protein GXP55_12895 [Deltaproteobacteria bacterium]|nr:hypothetical protein [Deltaproteobacteria bacterium]
MAYREGAGKPLPEVRLRPGLRLTALTVARWASLGALMVAGLFAYHALKQWLWPGPVGPSACCHESAALLGGAAPWLSFDPALDLAILGVVSAMCAFAGYGALRGIAPRLVLRDGELCVHRVHWGWYRFAPGEAELDLVCPSDFAGATLFRALGAPPDVYAGALCVRTSESGATLAFLDPGMDGYGELLAKIESGAHPLRISASAQQQLVNPPTPGPSSYELIQRYALLWGACIGLFFIAWT